MLMIKKTFKSYLDQDAVHKLITTMVKESIPWCRVMKEHFNKELVMTKEGDENFETSTNRLIRDDTFVKGDVEVRDHSHVTGKYRGSAHRNCDVNISLNYKFPSCLTIWKVVMYILLCKNLANSILK